ncbi:MAG: Ion transport protein [Bacillus sp. (in: firmicutes)]|jgi:potassium channel LctB|uniref:ion channel n=1 Tax=Bacillus sp. 1NLA3E TaxID=666686 RepID=UPI000247E959|nr:ion channel [Bacillus sp. 1NLA3E]AGK52463.1 Ion transport protein [Bacillus sp. 1NLA3E]MDF2903047.1 Ion transport protein [Bacillus sp. (in: firmicutes)]
MTFYLMLIFVLFSIGMSLRSLFLPYKIAGKYVSLENFIFLAMVYATIMIGFGLIYMLLDMKGNILLIEETRSIGADFFSRLETFIYFSGMTLFSVGYGDIAPIGIGRVIAVLEALIGYTIPAAFVARAVFDRDR